MANARRALARAEVALRHDTAEADRQIASCLEIDRSNLLVWRDWLKILEFRGDTQGMVEVLGKLPATYPSSTDAELWEYVGLAFQAKNDLASAATALRRAVALQPSSPTNVYRLARVEQRLGETRLAAEHRRRSTVVRETIGKLTPTYLDYMDLVASKTATTIGGRNAAVPDFPSSSTRSVSSVTPRNGKKSPRDREDHLRHAWCGSASPDQREALARIFLDLKARKTITYRSGRREVLAWISKFRSPWNVSVRIQKLDIHGVWPRRLRLGSHPSLPSLPSVRDLFAPGRTSLEIPSTRS